MVRSIILLLTLLVAVANSVPVLNVEPEPRITKNDTFELNSEEFVEVNEPELRKPTEKPSVVNEDPIKVEHKELHRVELTNGKSSDDKKDSDNKLCNEFCAKKLEVCFYFLHLYHNLWYDGINSFFVLEPKSVLMCQWLPLLCLSSNIEFWSKYG